MRRSPPLPGRSSTCNCYLRDGGGRGLESRSYQSALREETRPDEGRNGTQRPGDGGHQSARSLVLALKAPSRHVSLAISTPAHDGRRNPLHLRYPCLLSMFRPRHSTLRVPPGVQPILFFFLHAHGNKRTSAESGTPSPRVSERRTTRSASASIPSICTKIWGVRTHRF